MNTESVILILSRCVQRLDKVDKTGTLILLRNSSVRKLLDDVLTWKFDIIALESHCKLQYVKRHLIKLQLSIECLQFYVCSLLLSVCVFITPRHCVTFKGCLFLLNKAAFVN